MDKFYSLREFGDESVEAMRELYSLFDDETCRWVAGLYDPDIGGFYFSESAKRTEGYLPDIESTYQALKFLSYTGCCEDYGHLGPSNLYAKALPEKYREKIAGFIGSLSSPDGYFYHPQWGSVVKPSRKGRDLSWSRSMLTDLGKTPKYPYATEQMKHGVSAPTVPDYIKDADKLIEYLEGVGINSNSYVNGQQISAQSEMIAAAGHRDVLMGFLNSHKYPHNGLWEKEVTFNAISGLLKLGAVYNKHTEPMPYIEQTLESAIRVAISDELPSSITGIYNPIISLSYLITNMSKTGREDLIPWARERIRENAAGIIRALKARLMPYKREDGAFSYFTHRSCPTSQGCPVSPSLVLEGDMNALLLAVGCVMEIVDILGIPKIPIFSSRELALILDTMDGLAPTVKTDPIPEHQRERLMKKDYR